jgi:patatin-like phospholipase/acyl hydrolase
MENARRILSIDGGGIKGALPAAFLAAIEESTGKRIVDHFDLIAGTSTGGIIALGLGLGMTAAEILAFYENEGPAIFSQETIVKPSLFDRLLGVVQRTKRSAKCIVLPKYDSMALRSALENAFGDRRLGDSQVRLVIPAFDRQRREVHVFKTAHHERFRTDWKERAVDVALATAAAPTYLPGHRLQSGISLLDGGIWANNPVGLAAVEAVGVLGWPREQLRVLSLGCSEAPIEIPENAGIAGLALKMSDIFLLGQSCGSTGTAKLLVGDHDGAKRFLRVQHMAANGEFELDAIQQIPALKGIGMSLARTHLHEVEAVFLSGPLKDPYVPCYREPQ